MHALIGDTSENVNIDVTEDQQGLVWCRGVQMGSYCMIWHLKWVCAYQHSVMCHGRPWTERWAVSHHGSQAALNTWLGPFLCNFAAYLPISAILKCKMNTFGTCCSQILLVNLTNSVHEHHTSHPVNTWWKWYSTKELSLIWASHMGNFLKFIVFLFTMWISFCVVQHWLC
jgi:hypothetical protein